MLVPILSFDWAQSNNGILYLDEKKQVRTADERHVFHKPAIINNRRRNHLWWEEGERIECVCCLNMQHSTALLSYKTRCAFQTLYSVSACWLGCVGNMSTEWGEGTFLYGFSSALMVALFIYGQLENHWLPWIFNVVCGYLSISTCSPRLMDAALLCFLNMSE